MSLFIGREHELEEFHRYLRKKSASLIVCQGRRRIGKSTFFRHGATKADHFIVFEGLPPRENIGRQNQLDAFAGRLAMQTKVPKMTLEGWPQAFQLLASALPATGSLVLLLDEISWMAIGDKDFVGHLKAAWDNYFSQRPHLIVVLCGSVSSWIQANILNNTGFVGRCSWQLYLPPLSLLECNLFWKGKPVSASEKLKLLSVTGGVPRYLEEIDISQTAEQNIERLCFRSGGMLFNEFDQIFHDIFSRRADTYRQIVATLVNGARSVSEISTALKQDRGGTLSAAIEDLELAGFLKKEVSFSPATGRNFPRTVRYRIQDNYLRFYLKYIEPVRDQIEKGLYRRVPIESLNAWDTIMGLQFENLVLGNLKSLLDKIGLTQIPILNAGPYFQSKTQTVPGCQIDLLLRAKESVYIFEMKLRRVIDLSVIAEVRRKVECLKMDRSLSVRTGLVYLGNLDPKVEESDFFDHLVSFDRLLA